MTALPPRPCRHRRVTDDLHPTWICDSPLVIVPGGLVTNAMCATCCYAEEDGGGDLATITLAPPKARAKTRSSPAKHSSRAQTASNISAEGQAAANRKPWQRWDPERVSQYAVEQALRVPGYVPAKELAFLARTAAQLLPGSLWVEVGSFAGRSLLATGLALSKGSYLASVEAGVGMQPDDPWTLEIAANRQRVIRRIGERSVRTESFDEASVAAAARFADRSLDVVFLDADPTEPSLAADIRAWLPKLKPGGLLCGRGYSSDKSSVAAAVDRLLPKRSLVPGTTIWRFRLPKQAPPSRPPHASSGMKYLSVAAIYKCETPWLREWIEYHRNRGVEHFLLFNNDDDPVPSEQILAPYVASGLVTVHRLPGKARQYQAIQASCEILRYRFRWMAHIDLDEFLLPRRCDSLCEMLEDYERHPGLAINWRLFGTSGLRRRPRSQINDLLRCSEPTFFRNHFVKSIVDPARVVAFEDPHFFQLADGPTVDETHRPLRDWHNKECPQSIVRINHYSLRSLQDFFVKIARGRATTTGSRDIEYFLNHDRNECFDDEIKRRFGHEVL